MTDRDTEPKPAPAAEAPPADFLRRWSRRKQAVVRGEAPPEPTPPAAPAAEPPEAAPLPDPASLSLADDFSGFLRAKVPEALKRQAMRQLFSQAHFNVVDGLDVYMEDFNAMPDLRPEELALLKHAREVLNPTPQQRLGGEDAEAVLAEGEDAAADEAVATEDVTDAAAEPAEAAADDAPDAPKADAAEPVAADARAVGRD